jgi:glycosyltransferase involved in cell wall biosynthesis
MRVLMITCEWPTEDAPHLVPFVVRQVEFLRRAGVDVDVFAFKGRGNPLKYLKAWIQVHRKMRDGDYDVAHAQWFQSGLVALPTRLPLVVTDRGGEGKTLVGAVLRMIGAWVTARADELVVVSEHLGRHLPKAPHVIPSGLDLSRLPLVPRIDARRELGLPVSKRLVLFVGNPDEARKRYTLAREVVARLPRELDAELVVAWKVPHDRVILQMNACDALLFTSSWEGSPNVVKEALACNLPVVATDVGDVRERLRDVTGCAVCQPDADLMAGALAPILERCQRTMGRQAVRALDERNLVARMIQIYERAAHKGFNGGVGYATVTDGGDGLTASD